MRLILLTSMMLTGCAGSNIDWTPVLPLDSEVRGESLTCNTPWADTLPTTNTLHLTGVGFTADIGVNRDFGGIGTLLALNGVNLLDTRSGTGAAWQWSNLNTDSLGVSTVFNQASGNTIGSQWGESNSIKLADSSIGVNFWNTMYPDTINSGSGMTAQSPCVSTGISYDYGAPYIQTSANTTISIRNSYTYMAKVNQTWSNWAAVNAIYFTRGVARQTNLRVYFAKNGVVAASAITYNDFIMPGFNCTSTLSGLVGSFCRLATDYDYVIFVFTIKGQDLAVVIPGLKSNSVLGLEENIYCPDISNDDCGSIFLFNQVYSTNIVDYIAGQKRSFYVDYVLGTTQQVSDLGYKIQ